MATLISLILFFYISNLYDVANGKINYSWNINWTCPQPSAVQYIHSDGTVPVNLTCTTNTAISGELIWFIVLNNTVLRTTIDATLTIIGNKLGYAYGIITDGACTGGFIFAIIVSENSSLKQCKENWGIEMQRSSIANAVIYGGGCGLNTCAGDALISYSPPLTF